MNNICPCCIDRVGRNLKCPSCNGLSIKYGMSSAKKQRYLCKSCNKTFIQCYTRRSYLATISTKIIGLLKEGVGISGMSRYLQIAKTTVLRRILKIAGQIKRPPVLFNQIYEMDEQWTYIKSKKQPAWIIYALCRESKQIADFVVGSRTNETIQRVVNTIVLSRPVKIYTDRLLNYRTLIPSSLHVIKRGGTNNIERQNLSNRTDLKRLSRRTICYSKSLALLSACLRIYFWG